MGSMTFLGMMVSLFLLPMAVWQPVAMAQSPRLATGTPHLTSHPDNTLSISLPMINSGTEAASRVHVTGITFDTSPRLIPRVLPVTLGDIDIDKAVHFEMLFDSSRMIAGKRYLLTVRGTYDVGALTWGFTVSSYIDMAQIPQGMPVFSPGEALLNSQGLEFTVLDPSQDGNPGSTVIFPGTVTNNTGAALNATDLFFNFFGFDPTAVSAEQLLGNPDFPLADGSISDIVNLLSVRLEPDADIGQTYAVNVFLQDINGNESSVTTLEVTVMLPPAEVRLTPAMAENLVGTTHTVTATVLDEAAIP